MSNTLRFFVNDKRVSTAVNLVRQGYLLQVYPMHQRFADEEHWKNWWTDMSKPRIRIQVGSEKPALAIHPSLLLKAEVLRQDNSYDEPEWELKNRLRFTAPPGKYYIGDLCYVLSDHVYENVFGDLGGYDSGLYQKKNSSDFFLVDNTAYGDGLYGGSDGNEFGVDAGIIGICPVSLIEKGDGEGTIYEFKEPVVCRFNRGCFTFTSGSTKLVIDTAGEEDQDEEDYDYDQ